MNERETAEELIASGGVLNDAKHTIGLLLRYAIQELGMSVEDAKQFAKSHVLKANKDINYGYVDKYLEYYSEKAAEIPLIEMPPVKISKKELAVLAHVESIRGQCLLFAMLAIAKHDTILNREVNYWIRGDRIQEVSRRANLALSIKDLATLLHKMYKLGLIEMSSRFDTYSVRLCFAEADTADTALILTDNDFRDLGFCYRAYIGDSYLRCEECGRWIKQARNGRRRFCDDCAADNHRALNSANMRRKRT